MMSAQSLGRVMRGQPRKVRKMQPLSLSWPLCHLWVITPTLELLGDQIESSAYKVFSFKVDLKVAIKSKPKGH